MLPESYSRRIPHHRVFAAAHEAVVSAASPNRDTLSLLIRSDVYRWKISPEDTLCIHYAVFIS